MAKAVAILEIAATVTGRGQTTVPAAIRKMLSLGKHDQVVFRALADGTVSVARRQSLAGAGDPVIGGFLEFLARDMADTPARIQPVPAALVARGRALVEGIEVDLEAALRDDEA